MAQTITTIKPKEPATQADHRRYSFFRMALVVMLKDLRAELRTKEAINGSFGFAVVILLLFSFAFDPDVDTNKALSGGLLWLVFAFAGTLILNRSFARELPNDCLDALIAAPVSGAPVLQAAVAKFLAVTLVGIAINISVFTLMLDVAHLHYVLAQLVGTGVGMVWSFWANKLWTFGATAKAQR